MASDPCLDNPGLDWASVQARSIAQYRNRPATHWLVCCGSSSPLVGVATPDLQVDSCGDGRFRGSWIARTTALAVADAAFHGVVLSHCLEDQYSPLSQLDEALRVLRPGGHLSVWLWGPKGAGQSPGPAIARRSLRKLRTWTAKRPLQLIELTALRRGGDQLLQKQVSTLPLLQRWWQLRSAELLRLDYRYGGTQGIGVRRLVPLRRRVSLPAQGLTRV